MRGRNKAGFVVLLASVAASLGAQQIGFIEHPVPTVDSVPFGIAAGPDGALWFTEGGGNKIGRITTAGAITEYPVPTVEPYGITAGPDGALWFTEYDGNKIGRITTAGALTEYPVPTAYSHPEGITAGPDGALWFAESSNSKIGRITTAGAITEYLVPNSFPQGITAGPDGALWFTEEYGNQIGRITTAGAITEYPVPTASSYPYGITAGPDGALWFTEEYGNKIGRITTAGAVTEYPVPTASSYPYGITAGPDGALWFTEIGGNQIGRITTAGAITEYLVPTTISDPYGITAGPDGALWFTEQGGKIGQAIFTTAVLSASPASGAPGSSVTLTGSGFSPAEKVNLYKNSTGANPLGTATADGSGAFSVSGPVHPAPYGPHSVAAVGQSSGRIGLAPFSITPRLTVTPASVAAGSTITIRGYGFGASERVQVYWNNPPWQLLGTATANNQGTFSQGAALTFTIPADAPTGVYVIGGKGQITLAFGEGQVNVQ